MKKLWIEFKQRPWWRKTLNIVELLFAMAGFGIVGAWAYFELGLTNDSGGNDQFTNERSLTAGIDINTDSLTQEQIDAEWALRYGRLAALARYYPVNARLILNAAQKSNNPLVIDRMIKAAEIYMGENKEMDKLTRKITDLLNNVPQQQSGNVIPWMDGPEWPALKEAILRDSALIIEAGRLTGVEPRLIVGCLVGEQIRLFNSKREMFKKYLGPVKVLSVQSQFSYGVNGIKEFTAKAVEEHLKDPNSEYYMGPAYEHLLDFTTNDHTTERYNRLVDYRNHLYSFIYTGCILHQTMLQWKRAGYDISDRPDLLFTLFNVGFSQSVPKADPKAGGSHIEVGDRIYTFGGIGYDFYYSGEMADVFPFQKERFAKDNKLTEEDVANTQRSMSNCSRPERGLEYKKDSSAAAPGTVEEPDPFGIDHEKTHSMEHIPQ